MVEMLSLEFLCENGCKSYFPYPMTIKYKIEITDVEIPRHIASVQC